MEYNFILDDFQETVTTVGATRIIPIHWDDFMRPFEEPLRPSARIMDDFDGGMSFMIEKVKADTDLKLLMLPSLGKIELFHSP